MSDTPSVVGIQIALAARLPMRSVERIEVEEFTERFWGSIQTWRAEESAGSPR